MKRVVPIVVLACALSSCWFSHKPKTSVTAFTVVGVQGSASMTDAEGSKALTDGMNVPLGATVNVADGSVTIGRGDSTLELRPTGAGQTATMTMTSLERADTNAGLLLAKIDAGARIDVASQGVFARAPDAALFRFDRLLSVRVGSYRGDVEVSVSEDPSADKLVLSDLDEAVISGRVLPRTTSPYAIERSDSWDRKHLGDVIALDEALQTQSLGFQRQSGSHFGSVFALQRLAKDTGTDLSFVSPFLRVLTSGDVVIGIQLSMLVAKAHKQQPSAAFRTLVADFNEGATWGELARKNGVVADLRHSVERAVAVLFGEVRASPTPSASASASPTPSVSPTRTPTSTPTPPPPPPQGLGAPSALTADNGQCNVLQSTAIELAWRASATTNAGGYEIFRREGSGSYASIGTVDGRNNTAFTDQSVKFSTRYDYKVRTIRGSQRSAFSNVAGAMTKSNLCQ